MAVKLNSSGGGSVTLDVGSTASNYSLTLPSTNGTLATTDGGSTTFTSITDSGNLAFTGTGNRITGDFSNATVANRVLFQTSTANGATVIGALPNGSSTNSVFLAYNSSDVANTARAFIGIDNVIASFRSDITGTGTYLPMVFYTGGSERVRIDTSGNFGVGNSSPVYKVDAQTSSLGTTSGDEQYLYRGLTNTGNSDAYNVLYKRTSSATGWTSADLIIRRNVDGTAAQSEIHFGSGNYTSFWTNGSERMRIDSNGNLIVGTTSSFQSTMTVAANNATGVSNFDAANLNSGSNTTKFARYSFSGADTVGTRKATAFIDCFPTDINYVGSYIAFSTRGSDAIAERMRIDGSGNVSIGSTNSGQAKLLALTTSTTLPAARFFVQAASSLSNQAAVFDKYDNNTTTSQVFVGFSINNQGTASGQINANGASQAAFGSWSDRRLKENIVDLDPQLDNICALRPVEFDYKDGSGHQIGFVAQEVQEVYPDAVGDRGDGMLTVTGWSKTEARLIKAIQELKAELDELKAKVK